MIIAIGIIIIEIDPKIIIPKERLEGYFLLNRLILENKTYLNLEIYRNIARRGENSY